jgi:hypothetical protein
VQAEKPLAALLSQLDELIGLIHRLEPGLPPGDPRAADAMARVEATHLTVDAIVATGAHNYPAQQIEWARIMFRMRELKDVVQAFLAWGRRPE